jgi:cbb3-type cytochrome oxidase subunit 3
VNRNIQIGLVLVALLLAGLVIFIFVSNQKTNKSQEASGNLNLNTVNQIDNISQKGPKDATKNYSNTLPKSSQGSLTLLITDPPLLAAGESTFPSSISDLDSSSDKVIKKGEQKVNSLIIRIKKVEVHMQNGDRWETLNIPYPISVDLAQLIKGQTANLSLTNLSEGKYDEIRLFVDKAESVLKNGNIITPKITGKDGVVRIKTDFLIEKGKNTNLVVDFNAQKSVVYKGKDFVFKPFVQKVSLNK